MDPTCPECLAGTGDLLERVRRATAVVGTYECDACGYVWEIVV